MFAIAWVPDACHNPISPGFEPASAVGERYKDPYRQAELICWWRRETQWSLLLPPPPRPHQPLPLGRKKAMQEKSLRANSH